MPVPQIALLSNPHSTRNRSVFRQIRRVAEETPNIFHYEIETVADIPQALKEFARTSPAMLVINGGDGTIQAVLTCIANEEPFKQVPPIAILPSGKTNMIAHDLGAKGRPNRVLRRIIELVRTGDMEGRLSERNLIEMNLGDGRSSRFGMFFGGAAVVNGILYCRRVIHPLRLPNFFTHALAFITLFFAALIASRSESSPLYSENMEINLVGGGILKGRYMMVLVTTLYRLLLGLRPYGMDGTGPLRFSCVDYKRGAVFRAFRGLVSGRYGRTTIRGVNVRRVSVIRLTGGNPVTLDGEIYEPGPEGIIELRGERSLTFLDLREGADD